MSVEAVIFDIGNVLIEWQPERYYDRTIGREKRRAMFDAVDLHGMNERIDRGENFRDVVYAVAAATPGWQAEIRDWHDCWIELAEPVIPHSLSLLRALRSKGVPVHALTNFGVESFALAKTHYPFLNEFDTAFVSGHMGVTKPDPRIYEMVEATTRLAPETLLFTDDRAENIEAAAARGWQVHLFEGAGGLAERLVSEGLLSAREAAP
ncbi:2-haloacid dehalogenase [Palleronia aestuarii]|uniref:2-haloacid dehalogenase n=1 Tax=Palleronia aestuarii TaxID=568105 RepID=A0A2W7NE43_9RHOB|nr:HAD family phosphatase [Palleronia aestuarii]PZX15014.1 2-haloacid dehalogenase [Palleronia aestuarii]